jgi:glycolate oxidase FAD binding subunit
VFDRKPSADFLSRAAQIVGDENVPFVAEPVVSAADAAVSHYRVDGMNPALAVRPETREEVRDIVRLARDCQQSVISIGAGTKLRMGMRPRSYALAVDMTRLNRVLAYDPGDLTISVEAGCPLRDVQAVVAARRQFLPYDPPYSADATIGGSLAANSWSLCAEGYGTPRDFVLGMEFVTGQGELAHSGGRVVKNVTGYDLHKLMIGSFGTLGAIVSVNFRLYPLLRERRLFAAPFASPDGAFQMLREIRASFLKPRTLVLLDPGAAAAMRGSGRQWKSNFNSNPDSWTVVAIVEGHSAAIERHQCDLERMALSGGAREFMVVKDEVEEAAALLRESMTKLRQETPASIGARIGVPATETHGLLRQLQVDAEKENLACAILFQASGLAHLTLWSDVVSAELPEDANDDLMARLGRAARRIFEAAKEHRARAVIESCPVALKSMLNIWGEPSPDFALVQKVKSIFDPGNIFSPGRFVGGL